MVPPLIEALEMVGVDLRRSRTELRTISSTLIRSRYLRTRIPEFELLGTDVFSRLKWPINADKLLENTVIPGTTANVGPKYKLCTLEKGITRWS